MQWTPKIWWVYKSWVVSFCHYRQVVHEKDFEMDKHSFLNQWRILSCSVVVVFCLCSASDWGPPFSLFHGVRAREPHPCAGWRTCVEVMTTCHTRPDISHTKQKVGQEGEEDKINDLRQGQRRQRPKWPHLERHLVLDPYLCAQPCLWSCLSQDHLRWGQDTNTRTFFCCCLCCVPSAHGSSPENSFDI